MEACQQEAIKQLGAPAVGLIAWAWQRRKILGERPQQLLAALDPEWQVPAGHLLEAWNQAVRASSVVENWHSIVRPHLAVHRTLSAGMLALLAVWHNHRVAPRGRHKDQYISLKDLLQEAQVQEDRADRQNRGTDPQD